MAVSDISMYFQERFPIVGVALISVIFALFGISLQQSNFEQPWIIQIALLSIVFAAFLLRQRVTDEFKDRHHDKKHYPSRPFQRGLIGERDLVILGTLAFIVEITAVLLIDGLFSIMWYLPVIAYSLFMVREFFVSKWLEKHFTVYFVLHEIIFIWFAVWLAHIMRAQFDLNTFTWIVGFTCAMVSIEVARKFDPRRNSDREVVQDTYSAVWGHTNALTILQLLTMITGIALSLTESSVVFAVTSGISVLALSIAKRGVFLQSIVVLHLLLVAILALLI